MALEPLFGHLFTFGCASSTCDQNQWLGTHFRCELTMGNNGYSWEQAPHDSYYQLREFHLLLCQA
jgi:hypothetical protein